MGRSESRALVFGGLAAGAAGVAIAVSNALGAASTSGVAGAHILQVQTVHHTVQIDGTAVHVTTKPSGTVCFSAPHASGCASTLSPDQISYATGHAGAQLVIAGVAGSRVKAVIARLTGKGAVWPALHGGAFYAVLPGGHRLASVVKVLAGGRRVAFKA